MTDNSMLAPCGIDCSPCPIRRAASDPEFREEFVADARQSWAPGATAEWFRCKGCRGDDSLCWGDDCGIRSCCLKKRQLPDCSWCDDFPCKLIIDFEEDEHGHHTDAVANLRRLRASRK